MIRHGSTATTRTCTSFVERQLVARIGDAGRRLHTGRSRNEQVSVDLRLYLRRRIPLLQDKLRAAIAAFADQAENAGEALMPSYTHMRRAMPVLVSHFLLVTRRRCGAITLAWRRRARKPMRCRSARAPSPAQATPSTRSRSPAGSVSIAS